MPELYQTNRTWLCSVLFMDIVNYSSQSVEVQIKWKERFNNYLGEAIKNVPEGERVILDTGDGAAICFLGAPFPEPEPWGWITVLGNYPDGCSPAVNTADEVMNVGVSKLNNCPHRPVKKFALPPKPGQIVVYVPEYTQLERFLYLPWNY